MSYLVKLDGVTYEPKGAPGGAFTLVDAMREVYGVGGAQVVRLDGTVAVDRAGSATEVVHVLPDGRRRTVRRRLTWRARREELAGLAPVA